MSKLSPHLGSEISLKDFSFSQLIIAVKTLFDTEGSKSFWEAIVNAVKTQLLITTYDFQLAL